MPAKRAPKREHVSVYVDYENIRRAIVENYPTPVSIAAVGKALKVIAGLVGDFRGGTFYGDWTLRPEDAREIESHGFKAELVLRTTGRKDRTDVQLAVEMMAAAARKETRVLILAAGDGDYKPLIRKVQEGGKKVVVCAIGQSISRDLLTIADSVVLLEKQLGLVPPEPTAIAVATPSPTKPDWEQVATWVDFVQHLSRLEKRLPMVSRNYFRDLLPGDHEQREATMVRALQQGIVTPYELPNPKMPGRTMLAVRLAQDHPTVLAILSASKLENGEVKQKAGEAH